MSIYKSDINFSLNFGANTQQAQQQIQALQTSLNKLSSAGFGANATKGMKEAAAAAQQLQTHLQKAYNTKTGNLDLGLLNKSLTSANTDINKLSASLIGAGKDGATAFTNLARSIANANQPMLKTNTLLGNMWTTLKNTARWQISSSILQGFMGSVQKAYGYAQDLNKSLTDIRIVTSYSADKMSDFAVEANKAAKALSTTTNEYAKASLIYFQQGLGDQQVKERTDVTVKMANVTRESAQTVSDQMTAIWNNFDDGSKSLEYYADVITALGAATASSTDEISQGLEKFAAVAETVGLSYEYATSALATITSNTRQSADVVGTALKTLFARIQGLSLGETLDDGTDLNKYSEALAKVGISIKESNGELKAMDDILDEMAAKWDTINNDQQVALAQTVAGVRQYTQLVALMDNWNSGDEDSMVANLRTVENSEGTLQEQSDIYAESWEAASKRAKAALEEIYGILLDDSFFIKLTNAFADLTSGIGEFLKSFGGVKNILLTIASIFLMNFANKIPQAIETVRYNLSVLFGSAAAEADKAAHKFNEVFTNLQNDEKLSSSQKQQIEYSSRLMIAKNQLAKIQNELTDAESLGAQVAIQSLEAQQQEVDELRQKISELKNGTTEVLRNASEKLGMESKAGLGLNSFQAEQVDDASVATVNALANAYSKYSEKMDEAVLEGHKINELLPVQTQNMKAIYNEINFNKSSWTNHQKEVAAYVRQIERVIPSMKLSQDELTIFNGQLETLKKPQGVDSFQKALESVNKTLAECGINGKGLSTSLNSIKIHKNVQNSLRQISIEESKIEKLTKQIKAGFEQLPNVIKHTASAVESVSKVMGSFGTMAMGLRSIKSAFDTLADPDVKGFEKFTSVIMSLGLGLPMIVKGVNNYKEAISGLSIVQNISTAATELANKAQYKKIAADAQSIAKSYEALLANEAKSQSDIKAAAKTSLRTMAEKLGIEVTEKFTNAKIKEQIISKLGLELDGKASTKKVLLAAATALNKKATDSETVSKGGSVAATIAQTVANWALSLSMSPVLLATLLITAALIALVAIVWGLVSAFKALSDAYNADKIAAEEAAETASKMAEAYEEVKKAYEDMIATMEEYKTAREALDELTEGTEEYSQALQEANRAALELINNYPDLFNGGDYHWENGELIINSSALDKAKGVMANRESQAYAASQIADVNAKKAQDRADETAVRRDMAKDMTSIGEQIVTGYMGLLAGISTGVGSYGVLIGETILSSVKNAEIEKSDIIEKAALAYQKNKNLFSGTSEEEIRQNLRDTLEIEDDDLIDALMKNKDSVIELSESMKATAEANRIASQTIAAEYIDANKNLSYYEDKDSLIEAGGKIIEQATDKAQKELTNTMSTKEGLKTIADSYFKNQGISNKNGFEVEKYNARKGIVKYSYLDEEGKRVEAEVTAQQIAASQAAIAAQNDFNSACLTLIDTFKILDQDIKDTASDTNELSKGMKSFLSTGNGKDLTKSQYKALYELSDKERKAYLNEIGINEQNISAFGYDSIEAMIESMGLEGLGVQWEKYDKLLNNPGTENLTLNQAENITSALEAFSDFFGEEAGNEMLQLASKTAESLDKAGQDEFWEQLGNISDYTDAEAWENFLAAMKESGELTKEQEKYLEAYVDTAKLAAKATKDLSFDELTEKIKSLTEIIEKISDGTRDITDEEYEVLKNQGFDVSNFAKTIDGYRYLGDTADLSREISEGIKNNFIEVEQNFNNLVDTASQALDNFTEAEKNLEQVRESSKNMNEIQKDSAEEVNENALLIQSVVKHILEKVKIVFEKIWEFVSGYLIKRYDEIVNTVNFIIDAFSGLWNWFLDQLEKTLNNIINVLAFILKGLDESGIIDLSGIELIDLEEYKVSGENFKTSDEIAAEEEYLKTEQDYREARLAIEEASPETLKTIESQADYMSDYELNAKKQEITNEKAKVESNLEQDIIKYGEDSERVKYWESLIETYDAQLEAYDKALKSKTFSDEAKAIEEAGFDPDVYENFVNAMKNSGKYADFTEEKIRELALANMQCERGLVTLTENWEDWQNKLKNGNETEAAEATTELQKAFMDITGLPKEIMSKFDAEFFKKYSKEINNVVKGTKGSIKEIKKIIGKEALRISLEVNTDLDVETILKDLEPLNDIISNFNAEDIEIGASIDDEDFLNSCQLMIDALIATGMSAEKASTIIQEYLSSLGFDIEVERTKVPTTTKVPGIMNYTQDPNTGEIIQTRNEGEGPSTFEGYVEAVSIKSITKNSSWGGNVKVNDSVAKDSGGGSGSESSAEPLEYEDEIERYHENTRALERLERALDKVSTAKDRAFGKERLRLIDEEIAATERLVGQQRALLHETREYLKQDFADIQQYGFTTDQYGEITNYDEVMKQQIDKYNAAVASGNEDAIEAAKEEYDQFKEDMEQYEETLTAYEEAQAQLQEYINQVVDLKLEKITTEVEIKILVNDKELTRLEYLLRKIEYEGKGAADAISLMGRQFEQINEKAKPIQEAIDKIYEQARAEGRGLLEEEVREIKSFYEDGVISSEEEKRIQEIYDKAASEDRMLTQAEEEQIQEYKEQLLELNEEVMDIVETIEGKFIETLEELNGKVDESIGRFATYTSMYQTLADVITLSGKANSQYGMNMLNALSANTVANASAAMRSSLRSYEALDQIYKEEQANLERAIQTGDERLIKQYQDRLHEVEMLRETSYESMLSSWSEALQAANDLFDTKLTNMVNKLKENIGDIDALVEVYDRAVELEDLYLSGNKSIYELSKLARDIGKDIEGTANIIAKNKLTGLLEQINKLRAEGVKLSQYDLEYWQAKYELELAEIALQEAQDAKAQVRLTRNTAGGWGYTYTADAEAISEAEQQYEDSLNNMQEIHDQYIRDYSNRLIKNRQELVNAFNDLDKTSLTYEEDVLKLKEHYFAQEEYLIAELEKAYERAGISYQDSLLGRTYGDASLAESHTNFVNSVTSMIQDEMIPAYDEFQSDVDRINEQAGTTVENAMEGIMETSNTIEEEVLSNIDDLTTGVKEVADEIWSFQETYGDAIAEMLKDNEEYYSKNIKMYQNFMDETEADKWLQYFDDMTPAGEVLGVAGSGTAGMTGAMSGFGAAGMAGFGAMGNANSMMSMISSLNSGSSKKNKSDSSNSSGKGITISGGKNRAQIAKREEKYVVLENSAGSYTIRYYRDHYTDGTVSEWKEYKGIRTDRFNDVAELNYEGYEDAGSPDVNSLSKVTNEEELEEWKKSEGINGLATGGYTGSWGPEGKWALLHEKELVLNKYDTENMLDMVNTLREIDWRAKIAELWDSIGEQFIMPIMDNANELLQNVQIEASFPNVSDHFEIEEAFNNLINTASQYANRKLY